MTIKSQFRHLRGRAGLHEMEVVIQPGQGVEFTKEEESGLGVASEPHRSSSSSFIFFFFSKRRRFWGAFFKLIFFSKRAF
jgi:hypothetical protein